MFKKLIFCVCFLVASTPIMAMLGHGNVTIGGEDIVNTDFNDMNRDVNQVQTVLKDESKGNIDIELDMEPIDQTETSKTFPWIDL